MFCGDALFQGTPQVDYSVNHRPFIFLSYLWKNGPTGVSATKFANTLCGIAKGVQNGHPLRDWFLCLQPVPRFGGVVLAKKRNLLLFCMKRQMVSWGRKSRPQVRIKLQNNYYSVFLNKRMTPQNAESSVHWADNTIITHEESPLFHCYDFARGNQLCNVRT